MHLALNIDSPLLTKRPRLGRARRELTTGCQPTATHRNPRGPGSDYVTLAFMEDMNDTRTTVTVDLTVDEVRAAAEALRRAGIEI